MIIHFFYRNENKFYYYKENFKKLFLFSKFYNENIKQIFTETILKKNKFTKINTFVKLHPFFSCNNETITLPTHWLNRLKFQQTNVVLSKLEDIQQFMHESAYQQQCATNDPTVQLTLDLFRGWDFENSLIKNFVYDTRYPREWLSKMKASFIRFGCPSRGGNVAISTLNHLSG